MCRAGQNSKSVTYMQLNAMVWARGASIGQVDCKHFPVLRIVEHFPERVDNSHVLLVAGLTSGLHGPGQDPSFGCWLLVLL